MPKVSEVIETLRKKYKGDEVIAYGIWTKKDVKRVAKEADVDLNVEEVNDVLNIITEDFDPAVGINDDVIEETISEQDDDDEDDPREEDLEDFLPQDDEE